MLRQALQRAVAEVGGVLVGSRHKVIEVLSVAAEKSSILEAVELLNGVGSATDRYEIVTFATPTRRLFGPNPAPV